MSLLPSLAEGVAALEKASSRPGCFAIVAVHRHNTQFAGNYCLSCDHFGECSEAVGETLRLCDELGRFCFARPYMRSVMSALYCPDCSDLVACDQNLASWRTLKKCFYNLPSDEFVADETGSVAAPLKAASKVIHKDIPDPALALAPAKKSTDTPEVVTTPEAASEPMPGSDTVIERVTVADSVTETVTNPVPETTTPTLSTVYMFPHEHPDFQHWLSRARLSDLPTLLRVLKDMCFIKSSTGSAKWIDYRTIRPSLCAISIALNERGAPAPRIRLMQKPPGFVGLNETDKLLSNDRQVIDLHWLKLYESLEPKSPYEKLFEGAALDFGAASNFVAKVGAATTKVAVLRLTERQQLLLATLQTKKVRDRWKAISDGIERADILLREYVETGSSRLVLDRVPDCIHCYIALRIARWELTTAAGIYEHLAGKEMSATRMRQRQKVLERAGITGAD